MSTKKEQQNRTIYEELRGSMNEADTPDSRPQKFIRNDRYFTICIYTFLLVVACTIAIKAIISFGQTKAFIGSLVRAIGPFLIAILIAYVLMPFVKAVHSLLRRVFKRLPDKPAMVISLLLVYLIGVGLMVAALIYVLPAVVRNIADLVRMVPEGYEQLKVFLAYLQEHFPQFDFSSVTSMLDSTQGDVVSMLSEISGDMIPVLYTASVSVVQWFFNFVIAIVVSVYMLYGKQSLRRLCKIVVYAVIPREMVPQVRTVLADCNAIFGRYVVSKMVDSLIIGILCAILMTILRLPYVFLISMVVGITNMIPYFGPFIGAVPGLVIELVVSPWKALIFFIMILCLQQFDGLYLGPKLMGNSTGMKPLWIIFAITVGGKFFGVIGMFLGVPVLAILAYLAELFVSAKLRKKGLRITDIW